MSASTVQRAIGRTIANLGLEKLLAVGPYDVWALEPGECRRCIYVAGVKKPWGWELTGYLGVYVSRFQAWWNSQATSTGDDALAYKMPLIWVSALNFTEWEPETLAAVEVDSPELVREIGRLMTLSSHLPGDLDGLLRALSAKDLIYDLLRAQPAKFSAFLTWLKAERPDLAVPSDLAPKLAPVSGPLGPALRVIEVDEDGNTVRDSWPRH